MKKALILTLIATALLWGLFPPKCVRGEEINVNIFDFCTYVQKLSTVTMMARQAGWPASETKERLTTGTASGKYANYPSMDKLIDKLVTSAYEAPIQPTPKTKEIIIHFFSEFFYRNCLEIVTNALTE